MNKEKTKPFNPFEYFETSEEVAQFMHHCWEDEDPRVLVTAISHWVSFHGVTEISQTTGINRVSLHKTISGKTQPKWETVHTLWMLLRKHYAI